MTSSNNPSSSANQDDPWEQLAEDLFGLEFGKEHAAHEPAAPAVQPVSPPAPESHATARTLPGKREFEPPAPVDEPPRYASEAVAEVTPTFDEPAEPEEAVENPAPESSSAKEVSPQDSYWDALANWNWDESEGGPGKPRADQRPSDQRRPEQRRSDHGRSGGGPPSRGGSRGRDESRGRRGERPERQGAAQAPAPASPPASTPASRPPRQTEAPTSDDFGLGLTGETPGFCAPAETVAFERSPNYAAKEEVPPSADSTPQAAAESIAERGASRSGNRGGQRPGERGPEAGKEGEFPRKRRRRRRRRGGRGGEGAPGSESPPASSAVPGTDWDDSAGPEQDLPDDEIELVAGGAGTAPVGESDSDQPTSEFRGRSQGRRTEEPSHETVSNQGASAFDDDEVEDDGSQEMILAGGGAGESDLDTDDGDDGDDESGEEQTVSYENMPTWEEAISYLLHPNQVQVEPVTGSGGSKPPRGAPPADQPRQTRHIGHRKHRR